MKVFVFDLLPYSEHLDHLKDGNITEATLQRDAGYLSSASFDYLRPENLPAVSGARERYRDMTLADVEREAEHLPWGTADEVIEQVHRFGSKVLSALKAHTVAAR